MVGFVNWPRAPFIKDDQWYTKGGQVTKPIIVVKCPVNYCVHTIQSSWLYLISKSLVTCYYAIDAASDWPCTFLHPYRLLGSLPGGCNVLTVGLK